MADVSLASQTMFAELLQRCLDAEFDTLYSERGRFVRVRSRGRLYWHFRSTVDGERRQIYVGPVTDASITDRVNRFADIKSDFKGRQELVRALIAAGLPSPDDLSGRVVEAIWKAGFFRLRGVLVGTVAFQAYAGPLGIKLSGRPLQTQDADFAQFFAEELGSVTLTQDVTGGVFDIRLDGEMIWSRKDKGRFPDIKEIKRMVRDRLAPGRSLGHTDRF